MRHDGRGVSHFRQRREAVCEATQIAEESPLRRGWDGEPAMDPAVHAQLLSSLRASRRLWSALRIGPRTFVPGHLQHSNRVAFLSLRISRALNLPDDLTQRIYRAAYLHDIGKMAVSPAILRKDAALTAEERKAVQVHSIIGRELLGAMAATRDLAEIAYSHHEHYDGNGYPDGLQGTRIPFAARVLVIADCLDAMTSRSVGRPAFTSAGAWAEVLRQAGRQFDPGIVEALARRGLVLPGKQTRRARPTVAVKS